MSTMTSRTIRIGVEGIDNLDTFIETIEELKSQLIQLEPARNWKFRKIDSKKTEEGLVDYLVFDNEG
jgi:hypothetical protein